MEVKILPSNEFWGRRSGVVAKNGDKAFRAIARGRYRDRTGRSKPGLKTVNIPYKWSLRTYKSKRSGKQ